MLAKKFERSCRQISTISHCHHGSMQGEGDGDCAAGESGGSEGGAERSGRLLLAAAALVAVLAAPNAAVQLL